MGGMIGPAPRGLNATLIDKERRMKKFFMDLLGGSNDGAEDNIRFDPSAIIPPPVPLGGITQRSRMTPSSAVPMPATPPPMQPEIPLGGGMPSRNKLLQSPDLLGGPPNDLKFTPPAMMPQPPMPMRPRSRTQSPMSMGRQRDLSGMLGEPPIVADDMGGQRDLSGLLGEPPDIGPSTPPTEKFGLADRNNSKSADGSYMDKYISHLEGRPRYEDHKSSTGRKIGAGILGSLLGTDFGIREAPYRGALRSWADEGAGLKEGADLEFKNLVENRRSMKDIRNYQVALDKYTLATEKLKKDHLARMTAIDERAKTAKDRNKIELLKHQALTDYRRGVLAERRAFRENVSQPRANAYVSGMENRVNGPLTGLEQKRITDQAYSEVGRDPRYSKWFDSSTNRFNSVITKNGRVEEKIDPELQEQIRRAVAKAEERVANRDREDYEKELLRTDWFDPFEADGALLGQEEQPIPEDQ